ncbi:hypothetical protein M0805_005048 [Coniferiporia weirii]|nr:hypothetical protein M0805_005048 [Coniferiporia weirii]
MLRSTNRTISSKLTGVFKPPESSDTNSPRRADHQLDFTGEKHANRIGKVSDKPSTGSFGLVDLPSFDSDSLTAILPVTKYSTDRIQHIIATLVSEQSHVSAIGLVCSLEALPSVDAAIRGGQLDAFLDVSVSIWPEGLGEGAAVMGAAAEGTTEYTLIMDSEGLEKLDEGSQEHLLSQPFLLDLPTGFCGGRLTEAPNRAVCILPHSESQTASFLVPPFVLPSYLFRGFNSSAGHDTDFWSDFGRIFIGTDGAGAFVQETEKNSDISWCRKQCQKMGLVLDNQALDDCPTTTTNDSETPDDRKADPNHSTSLAVILPTLDDLGHFSSAVCRFIQQGYETHVLILSYGPHRTVSRDSPFPWLHDQLVSGVCEIPFSALHSSLNDYANAEAAGFWLQSAGVPMSVVVYGTTGTPFTSTSAFEVELGRQSLLGTTVIKIPRDDLPFCDWIGTLSLTELRRWHIPDIEITVITDDRPKSLMRLLTSLKSARYFGDSVNIRLNVEQTADLYSRRIVDEFSWDYGDVFVHHRVVHAGLLIAVVESWYPHSNDSYGIILEDDVEVSPLFYAWAKMGLLRYRYGLSENRVTSLFGISLYQQKQNELRPEGRRPFDAQMLFDSYGLLHRNTPYLSQVPCSWGAVYFPEHWREFHSYLTVRFSEVWLPMHEPVVPHVRSNRWAKSWKRFFIEITFLRGYIMLYPNYDDFMSLSTNHLEMGSHVKEQPRGIHDRKKALFTLPLMILSNDVADSDKLLSTGLLNLPGEQLPVWSDLPVLNLLGVLSSEQELKELGANRQNEVTGCTTIGSQDDHRPFEAEELFTCDVKDVDNDGK